MDTAGAYSSNFTSKNFTSDMTAMVMSYPWRNKSQISSWVLLHETAATNFRSWRISLPSFSVPLTFHKEVVNGGLSTTSPSQVDLVIKLLLPEVLGCPCVCPVNHFDSQSAYIRSNIPFCVYQAKETGCGWWIVTRVCRKGWWRVVFVSTWNEMVTVRVKEVISSLNSLSNHSLVDIIQT